jgi:GNAT superfamily N-acetyltransferase
MKAHRPIALKAAGIWMIILLGAMLNGMAREAVLLPRLESAVAHAASGVALCAIIVLVSVALVPTLGRPSTAASLGIGAYWRVLTLAFEFGFGRFVQQRTWPEMLDAHNHAVAPLRDVRPLAATAALPSGVIVGGAIGRTWGACCELLQLWVDPGHCGKGTATRLLAQFERRGADRGCHTFYLTTLSFQAPDFYRQRGYAVLAQISG